MLSDTELKAMAEEGAKTVNEFILPFANAIVKLRNAKQRGKGAALTADEVKAIVNGFHILKKGPR